jgi:NADP-dependent 3-hydroxy acid dehydrogenase YdfG
VDGAIPIAVDITDPASVAAAAEAAGDVTLLVNNAGISAGTGLHR